MLTEIYIEALLADEVLADHVWEVWHAGLIDDDPHRAHGAIDRLVTTMRVRRI